jgi:hypothetical protein
MTKTIRSRSNKTIDDILEDKWKIVAKRVVAEPTPRTPFDAPRLGIYDYDVVPAVLRDASIPPQTPAEARREAPAVTFRRIG